MKSSGTTQTTITVLGAGYVGLSTAAVLSNAGQTVYLIEPDARKLKIIQSGRSFFYEDGIDVLIKKAVNTKRLIPTDDYSLAVPNSSIIFSCVGTPDNPDGSSNLSYVFAAASEAAKYLKSGTIYAQKSTVPVGTGVKIQELFTNFKVNAAYVSNPEFLREGTAIIDTLWFDRVVVGSDNKAAANKIIKLYQSIEAKRSRIASLAKLKSADKLHKGQYFITNRSSAELIKVTANAFLALKISFANSIAKLADHSDADINEVMDVVGADKRIGRAFLNAGRGYGGGCFPKDVSGLISSASEYGVDLQIMTAATELNFSMPGYIANKAKKILGKLENKKVAVLGLSYKAGTSDARKSPGVALANILARNRAEVRVFDPKAKGEAEENLQRHIEVCQSLEAAVKNADAVFITTDWPEFLRYNLSKLKSLMRGKLLVDCMDVYSIDKVEKAGLDYTGVGRNGRNKL